MSWSIFKLRVRAVMENGPSSLDDVARIISIAYDSTMKSPPAGDLLNRNPVEQGNVALMENMIKMVLTIQKSSPVQLPLINLISNSFVGYWSGATLSTLNIPIIPAPGSTSNLKITLNPVVIPGIQVSIPFTYEGLDDVDGFLNKLILAANLHLSTVQGYTLTDSLYPPTLTPAPGFIPWTGFSVNVNTTDYGERYDSFIRGNAALLEQVKSLLGKSFIDAEALAVEGMEQLKAAEANIPLMGSDGGANLINSSESNLTQIEKAMQKIGLTDSKLIIAIQANALKETQGLVVTENTNYSNRSRSSLQAIFGTRIKALNDEDLARIKATPESFANYMYGRPGNKLGNDKPGDGYKYRGRGFIQVTGKANYLACSMALYGDDRLVKNPDLLNNPEAAAASTAWYVKSNLKKFANLTGYDVKNLTQEQATHLITSMVAGDVIPKNGKGFLTVTALGNANKYAAQLALKAASTQLAATDPLKTLTFGAPGG
jgi:predicted chitinase